jgi:hypothetical protein
MGETKSVLFFCCSMMQNTRRMAWIGSKKVEMVDCCAPCVKNAGRHQIIVIKSTKKSSPVGGGSVKMLKMDWEWFSHAILIEKGMKINYFIVSTKLLVPGYDTMYRIAVPWNLVFTDEKNVNFLKKWQKIRLWLQKDRLLHIWKSGLQMLLRTLSTSRNLLNDWERSYCYCRLGNGGGTDVRAFARRGL